MKSLPQLPSSLPLLEKIESVTINRKGKKKHIKILTGCADDTQGADEPETVAVPRPEGILPETV